MIDDSALFHGNYDPVKAHEYYLKRRQLKGRPQGTQKTSSPRPPTGRPAGGKPNRSDTKSRQEELKRQREALKARLDHLQKVLADLVSAAKKRSGVKEPHKNAKAADTPSSKKGGGKDGKSEKLTASERSKKNQKARDEYEKEHPTSLSTDIKELHAQIEDIQAKIKKALADAKERSSKAGSNNGKSGSQNHQSSGPRGR